MKKTIDSKIYNTDTATLIASEDNGHNRGDFRYCLETLYRTQKGAFFLVGKGGPLSRYSVKVGNMSSGGTDLFPVDSAKALNWLESNNCQNEIDTYFSEQIEEAQQKIYCLTDDIGNTKGRDIQWRIKMSNESLNVEKAKVRTISISGQSYSLATLDDVKWLVYKFFPELNFIDGEWDRDDNPTVVVFNVAGSNDVGHTVTVIPSDDENVFMCICDGDHQPFLRFIDALGVEPFTMVYGDTLRRRQ